MNSGGCPVIEFKNAGAGILGKSLVSHLTFQVQSGEFLVLLGRSGSGKTTTLRMINRLLDPTEGEVLVEGKPTTDWDPIQLRRKIGYVIQDAGLFPHFTVEANIALVPRLLGWNAERIQARVEELFHLIGLDFQIFHSRYPGELSGGQRQRVGVARALAADPPILLMDEPFGALDPATRAELRKEFSALAKNLAKTILFVTHDVREALFLASRIGLFKSGALIDIFAVSQFLNASHPEARTFLSSLESSRS